MLYCIVRANVWRLKCMATVKFCTSHRGRKTTDEVIIILGENPQACLWDEALS